MRAILLCIPLLILTGCARSGQPGEARAPAASSPRITAAPLAVPIPRAGLWIVTVGAEGSGLSVRSCADGQSAQSDGAMGTFSGCRPRATRGPGGDLLLSTSCSLPSGFHVESHGVFTGDTQHAYRMHIDSVTTNAPIAQMNGAHTTDVTGRYEGACPPNMPPGSMEINGSVITREVMNARRAAAEARMSAAH